jgi:hypothetical protein
MLREVWCQLEDAVALLREQVPVCGIRQSFVSFFTTRLSSNNSLTVGFDAVAVRRGF